MEAKELILDYSKWRCGDDGENKVGSGTTALLNDQGFMCCLGQWCQQLGAPDNELLNNGEPQEVKTAIDLFVEVEKHNYEYFCHERGEYVSEEIIDGKCGNTLAGDCITINDNADTTAQEKITQLTELLAQNGITLKVINQPLASDKP